VKSRLSWIVLGLLGLPGLAGCATGGITPTTCEIEIVAPPHVETVFDGVDVDVEVRGRAGTNAVAWLAAKRRDGDYISGKGLELAPGSFNAVLEIKLTGATPSYDVVLELAHGQRCRDSS
jgi:hypothetical protein